MKKRTHMDIPESRGQGMNKFNSTMCSRKKVMIKLDEGILSSSKG